MLRATRYFAPVKLFTIKGSKMNFEGYQRLEERVSQDKIVG